MEAPSEPPRPKPQSRNPAEFAAKPTRSIEEGITIKGAARKQNVLSQEGEKALIIAANGEVFFRRQGPRNAF